MRSVLLKPAVLCCLFLSSCLSASNLVTQEENFFDWTDLSFSAQTYAHRREALATAIGPGRQIFVCPSADGFTSGATFRQEDDFLYLTGLELPNSVLVVPSLGEPCVLFVPRRDLRFESSTRPNDFPGRALADDPELPRKSGISDLRPLDELEGYLGKAILNGARLRVDSGSAGIRVPASNYVRRYSPVDALILHLMHSFPGASIENSFKEIAQLRMIKDPGEIDVIRRACSITMRAIARSAKYIAAGVDERSLEGELEAGFKSLGAQRVAFDSIIKSGPNSLWPWRILAAHYDRRNRRLKDGELVIYDVGCELDHYASDMGRTFPVSGKFTAAQKRRLDMITAASDAVIAAIRPGLTFADLRRILLDRIPQAEQKYMQASLFFGHHIGLSVGDASLQEVALAPGMIFTVEPWYYNHDEDIALFIEDNVLVTATGCENLTGGLPRATDELEAMLD